MEVESLQSSYFYQQVRSNHADLWAQASTKRLVLCVPQNCSLSSLDVSRRDVGTWWLCALFLLMRTPACLARCCKDVCRPQHVVCSRTASWNGSVPAQKHTC